MATNQAHERCNVALPVDATVQQIGSTSLKDLARQALRGSGQTVATVASVASVESVAPFGTKAMLKSLAKRIGIPVAVVDALSGEDLAATEKQIELCKGHLDGDGNPLAQSLLTFYLHALADRATGKEPAA